MSRVYWITGLSGAGKTTIGQFFFKRLKMQEPASVLLDGDELRKVFGEDYGYSESDRRKLAKRYARTCKFLAEQGVTVVICTVSMFHEVREWNRSNITDYKEIYIKVPMEVLIKRDQKGLYSRTSGETDPTVSGVDFTFEEPMNPDIIIDNDGSEKPAILAERLFQVLVYDRSAV